MAIFSKADKKVLIILVVALAIILLIGFVVYKYAVGSIVKVQNLTGGAQTFQGPENTSGDQSEPAINVPQVQIQAQGGSGVGALSVCLDKCGDDICQKIDPNCNEDSNLNCICPENSQECPQDCE